MCMFSASCVCSLSISGTMLYYLSKETRNTEYTTSKVQKCNFVPSFSGPGVVIQVCQAWSHEWNLHALVVKEGTYMCVAQKLSPVDELLKSELSSNQHYTE